ncbi:MAG TPA: TonB-dependent receptor [Bacteroidales bacterium]|nr:TonB-dependent receptor [Bacteroidales bacterium]
MEVKICILIIITSIANVFGTDTYSQTAKVTLDMKGITLEQVMDEIENQSEFYFIFNQKQVDINRIVDIEERDMLIDNILAYLFQETNVNYVVLDRKILLTTDPLDKNLLSVTSETELQQRQITGKITDENGIPLPGVNVQVEGTTIGTISDANGEFSIDVQNDQAVLLFTFIGYNLQKIPVAGRTTFDISLVPSLLALEEVVVIGYGTQRKANLTGAVGVATAEMIERRPAVSVGNALQGVIPNLNITQRNGDPTTSSDFNIRGYESINGGSPLILVDGVPMDLEMINPNDIKSISVLKDAAAAAIYGARAAFGVILVETKKGQSGKINLFLSTEQSMAKPIFLMDVVRDPLQAALAWNQAYQRSYGNDRYDATYIAGIKNWQANPTVENEWGLRNGTLEYYGNNDYQNKLIADFAPQQKYDFSISGATEKSSFYVSFGYLSKDGYLKNKEKNENYKRYNILMKADFIINKWLTLTEKIATNIEQSDKPHFYNWDVNINSAARVSPSNAIQFPDLPTYVTPGDRDKYKQYIGMYFGGTNFFPYLEQGGRETFQTDDIWLTQGITLNPIKGLNIISNLSFNRYNRNYQDVASKIEVVSNNLLSTPMTNYGFSADDFILNQNNYNRYYVFDAFAEYTFDQFNDHHSKVMFGYNQELAQNQQIAARARSLLTPSVPDLNATVGTQNATGGKSHVALRGVFFRMNYDYKEKYLVELNGRYDGSSRFPQEDRYGFFPSASLGWRISNESFLDGTRGWLDNLKIRASYGELGNQMLGGDYYPYIPTMRGQMSPFIMSSGQIAVVRPAGLVSPTLTWERVVAQNIGLDLTLFSGRFDASFDAYTRDTKDMLMNVVYPPMLGTAGPKANAADLRTSGWELSLSWKDNIGADWGYQFTLGISDNKSKITKYDNPSGALSENYVGKDLGEIWGYETEGIFQSESEITQHADQTAIGPNWRPGDMAYKDLNGDGKINAGNNTLSDPGDRKVIGNNTPRYSFGLNPDLKYKNWTLNIFFQGLFRDYLPQPGNWVSFYPYASGEIQNYFLTESWSEDNRDAYFGAPMVTSNGDYKNITPQSRYVQNAAYIRLKSLTLNYSIPTILLNKVGISMLNVYFSGLNLWEFTKMHIPLDPEQTTTLTQEYYFQRIYSLGLRVGF